MKKTIVALMALAGVTMADETPTLYSGDFSWSSSTPLTFTFEGDSPLTVTATSNYGYKAFTTATDAYLTQTYEATDTRPAITTPLSQTYTPARNVGTEGSWTLTLTIKNEGEQSLQISALTLSAFTFSGQGDFNNGVQDITFTVAKSETTIGSTDVAFPSGGANNGDSPTLGDYGVTLTPFTIEQGKNAIITITASEKVDRNGTFVGLQGISFTTNVVPEPTTATLSLLALAGLAARRRRR